MKKVIKLNENDLHKIVMESVKKTLTELDWRTYHNAAKKAEANGNDKLARKFRNHAEFDSSNRIYPQKNGEFSAVNMGYDEDGNPTPWGVRKDAWGDWDTIEGFQDEDGNYLGGHPYYLGKDAGDYYKELEQQANDYKSGKSKYVKGKGWE